MTERWLPITGSPGYWISDHGRARSGSRILKPWWVSNNGNRTGSLVVGLGRSRRAKVSHLVLEHFDSPRPPGALALHQDDDQANNRLTNLRWGTYSDNSFDAVRNGKHVWASRAKCDYGHLLDGLLGSGKRYCLTCNRIKRQRQRAERRAGIPPRPSGRPRKTFKTTKSQ
jgi:hypothetical protein